MVLINIIGMKASQPYGKLNLSLWGHLEPATPLSFSLRPHSVWELLSLNTCFIFLCPRTSFL